MKVYPEAVEHASEVIKLYPHVYEAFQTRARAHQAAGNLQAAYEDFSAAVRLSPQNRDLHRDLVNIKQEINNPSKPLPDDMFTASAATTTTSVNTPITTASPQRTVITSPQRSLATVNNNNNPLSSPQRSTVNNQLVIKEHRRLTDELKDVDSSGSTSSGVGSSLWKLEMVEKI